MTSIHHFALSEKGMRERNEDMVLAERMGIFSIFGVAEGVGSPECGPGPAAIAVSGVEKHTGDTFSSARDLLDQSFLYADEALFAQQVENPESGMYAVAMTIAVVAPDGNCVISTAGHRRTFFIADIQGEEKTEPGENQDAGDLAAGISYGGGPGLSEVSVKDGVLVLCSDGISDFISDSRIREIVRERGDDLEDACRKLVSEAFQNGSDDNMTVVAARASEP